MSARARQVTLLGILTISSLSQLSLAVKTSTAPATTFAANQEVSLVAESDNGELAQGESELDKSEQSESEQGKSEILVILGLVDSLHQDVRDAIENQLGKQNISYVEIDELLKPSYRWPDVDKVIATGAAGCRHAVDVSMKVPVVCTILTDEKFRKIEQEKSMQERSDLTAIVIDQPQARQATVASKIYPALSRYVVLSQQEKVHANTDIAGIKVRKIFPDLALAPQLSEAIMTADALIATPDSTIYNRSTLHTVLLTAYGYGKPVVGYSRAYVKAGALITAYSTPDHVFRQVAEMFEEQLAQSATVTDTKLTKTKKNENNVTADSESSPRYFSVVDNPSVANSLGLFRLFDFSADKTYEDKDFQS